MTREIRMHRRTALSSLLALGAAGAGFGPAAAQGGKSALNLAMVAGSQQYAHQALWIVLFPGLAIILTALSLQLLGDGIRDLLDPRLRKSM